MFLRLFIIFTLVPVIELGLLIYLGSYIGVLNTVAIVIFTAVLGAYMVRQEGLSVIYRIQRELSEGGFPAEELINGAMVLVAGALLLTPGFFTDALGFLLVFPASREVLKAYIKRYLKKHVSSVNIDIR